jgi:hypothetical protein
MAGVIKMLCTIGYEAAQRHTLVDRLRDVGAALLVDVRELPLSRRKGLSKRASAIHYAPRASITFTFANSARLNPFVSICARPGFVLVFQHNRSQVRVRPIEKLPFESDLRLNGT